MQITRFFFVSISGFVIDIMISYALASQLGVPLWLAAASGFTVAALGNYLLHELWTFRRGKGSLLSSERALHYVISACMTLLFRIVMISSLSAAIEGDFALAILIGTAAVSFLINFFISKFLIFSECKKADGVT